jgi:hypothetical protein
VGWDAVATGAVDVDGEVLVVDDASDLVAPLVACSIAERGIPVSIVTRWPMIGIENLADVYFEWLMPRVYESGVRLIVDHFVERIDGNETVLHNVHRKGATQTVRADWVVMVTARESVNGLHPLFEARGISAETIGDATAPRTTYESVYEGHRQARKI